MSKIKFLLTICLSTLLLISVGFTNAAQAEEINPEEKIQLTQEEREGMMSFFNEYNVDTETQLKLIEKIENGEVLDSYLPDSQPINTYTLESGNVTETVDVYEDGSIIVTSLDLSEATVQEVTNVENNNGSMISPLDLDMSDGSTSSGSGYKIYKNAYITSKSSVVRAAGFYADFTVVAGIGSYISYVDPGYYLTLFTGYSNNESLTLVNAKETNSAPAEVILRFSYVAFNGAGSTTLWLKLHIQNGKATTPSFL